MVRDVLTREEARRRAELLSNVSAEVVLDLTTGGATFGSDTLLRFGCADPGSSSFVDLDAAGVVSADLNGRALPPDVFTGNRLRLDGLAARNELRVIAECRYSHTGVGLHRFTDPVDGGVYLHTHFEPYNAHRVYTCFDQPSLKAPFTLTVRAPRAWTCVSNAPVVERDGGLWRFGTTLPLAPYLTALVAGPLHAVHDRHGDVDLGIYCRRSLASHLDAAEILQLTRQGLDYYQRLFALAYPFGKYDQLLVPEFNIGAMENAGCVTFAEDFLFRSRVTQAERQSRAGTILHEMAHMWFGDLVTMRWYDDLWLNESFATYMSTRALAEATRFDSAWAAFATSVKAWAYEQDQLPTTHPISADIVDTDAVRTNYDGITYAKGAAVLKQLVAWVGDDAFVAGLRTYFLRHAYGNAELADFLAALEETSGRDLRAWSREWLETAGVATLRPDVVEHDGRYADVALRQEVASGQDTPRAHRLAVGLYDLERPRDGRASHEARLSRRRRVELDVTGARIVVADLAGAPAGDLLLPNDDDLAYVKLRLDARSLATLQRHLSALRAPLARALCWGAAWDATRDAELPARRWVRLVAEHAGAEPEIAVLQGLLSQARTAIDRYTDAAHRPVARALLADAARRGLASAEPGSDAQLVWARALISAADDSAFARALLDGSARPPELVVDTELRWHALTTLAAAGAVGEEAIAAEERRDATDIGARHGAAARASRPVEEAKAAAWRRVLDDRDLPLATLRAVAGAFWQPSQDGLLASYADRYAQALPTVWAERTPDEAISLTRALYPTALVDPRTVAAADRALDSGALPPAGRRLLQEARDGTLRALKARAADRP